MAAERARDAHEPGAPALDSSRDGGGPCDRRTARACAWHPSDSADRRWSCVGDQRHRRTLDVPITVVELPSTRFDDTAEATAYYLFAEALTNAQKHAHATSIHVRATATTRTLDLEIADDGIGGATERAGGGLTGLRDRVEALGGTFNIDSPSGHGTRIAAAIPLAPLPR